MDHVLWFYSKVTLDIIIVCEWISPCIVMYKDMFLLYRLFFLEIWNFLSCTSCIECNLLELILAVCEYLIFYHFLWALILLILRFFFSIIESVIFYLQIKKSFKFRFFSILLKTLHFKNSGITLKWQFNSVWDVSLDSFNI